MRQIDQLLRSPLQALSLIALDLFAFYVSLTLAWIFRTMVLPQFLSGLPPWLFSYHYLVTVWWIPAIFLFFLAYEDLYRSNLPFWDETKNTVKAVSLAAVTILAIVTLGKLWEQISRFVLLGVWFSSLFMFPLCRLWGSKILHRVGIGKEKVLILGAGTAGRLVLNGLEREKHMGYEVVGFLDDDVAKKGSLVGGKKVFGKIKYFPRYVNKLGIKTVIIAMPSLPPEGLSTLTTVVQNYALNTLVIPDLKGIALLNTDLFHLFSEELFLMHIKNNLKSFSNRLIKRLFDFFFCLITFPLLLPVIGLISIVIRLETPGPAIYCHDRIGKKGAIFRCYKFRTMYRNSEETLTTLLEKNHDLRTEWEQNWKLREDPRITRVGKFLRKTSLDELPQLFNVLRGEMSIVGPRPYLPREKDELERNAQVICSSCPGITGLWQVSGRSETGYIHRLKLDAWYIMNWSLWLDIVIIFKTIRVVLKMEGAY